MPQQLSEAAAAFAGGVAGEAAAANRRRAQVEGSPTPSPSKLPLPLGLLATPSPPMRSTSLRLTLAPAAISNIREPPSPLIVGVPDHALDGHVLAQDQLALGQHDRGLTAAVDWMVSPLWAWPRRSGACGAGSRRRGCS